jgi:hypothetical protein
MRRPAGHAALVAQAREYLWAAGLRPSAGSAAIVPATLAFAGYGPVPGAAPGA